MSVFSKIKMSKKAAKNHKEKEKEKEAEPVKTSYKHVPTHAAFDALSGSPSSWSHGDRPRIREQNKRRTELGFSRTGSSLSTATMSNTNAAIYHQTRPLPRNSSYSSSNPVWFDRGGDLIYSLEKNEHTAKRHRPSRAHSYVDSGAGPSTRLSPLGSKVRSEGTFIQAHQSHTVYRSISGAQLSERLIFKAEFSPAISSGNSTSSNSSDILEMPQNPNRRSRRPQPTVYGEQDIFDKLHTSTTRKLGEAPLHSSRPVVPFVPLATTTIAPQQKQKNRWSMLGRKTAISAI